ncbi:NAD(P)-binding protein [Rhizodiscina lignyota]|uniref:NAD(P)-binding protein n=1 Tax=Rhizodiscina lignyota TaxID=1504668 RepID=A0A9P4IP03_9PEZI|nr:NAD(P)-binding protein [Rhizodiscina lignyota]
MVVINNFTKTLHSKVPSQLNPKLTRLPSPYTVCVIGASSGIGEHIAYSYASASATNILIASRDMESLAIAAERMKQLNPQARIEVHACDVTSSESVAALAQFTKDTFGRLDALILNSGYAGPVTLRIDKGEPEWVQRAFNVNAMGTYLVAHYFMPLIMASEGGTKTFIAVGSFAGCIRRGPIANTGYTVSKMAQTRLIEYLSEQFGEDGLLPVAIHPGAVLTPMAEGNTPEEFMPYLTDEVDLCGAVCVWLSSRARDLQWLAGRLISATWDMDELISKRHEIVDKDLLKFAMLTG